jgi:N-acetylmuramoyl-L-alanine amidase
VTRRLLTAALAALVAASVSSARASPPAAGRPLDPSLFAPGACVAFGPTIGNRHRTVYLDAGHGGPDPGAVGTTINGHAVHEAALTLRVVLRALPLLRAAGFRVVLDRTTAGAVARPAPGDLAGGLYTAAGVHHDLVERNRCADLARASILLGVYFDGSTSAAASGCITAYDSARPFWRSSLRLARLLQGDVLASLRARGWRVPDLGARSDVGLGSSQSAADSAYGHLVVLGPPKPGYLRTVSEMPGALIEPLFVTNPTEATIAASEKGIRAMADGLAHAAEDYLRAGVGVAGGTVAPHG